MLQRSLLFWHSLSFCSFCSFRLLPAIFCCFQKQNQKIIIFFTHNIKIFWLSRLASAAFSTLRKKAADSSKMNFSCSAAREESSIRSSFFPNMSAQDSFPIFCFVFVFSRACFHKLGIGLDVDVFAGCRCCCDSRSKSFVLLGSQHQQIAKGMYRRTDERAQIQSHQLIAKRARRSSRKTNRKSSGTSNWLSNCKTTVKQTTTKKFFCKKQKKRKPLPIGALHEALSSFGFGSSSSLPSFRRLVRRGRRRISIASSSSLSSNSSSSLFYNEKGEEQNVANQRKNSVFTSRLVDGLRSRSSPARARARKSDPS